MKLSRRSEWPEGRSAWAEAVEVAKGAGDLVDLRSSNPSAVGLRHSAEVYASLGDPISARYEPVAFGLASAREAVSEHYGRRGRIVDPSRVWLAASTSEAYAHLLTLLGDPGDAVLVPEPGYPLLDILGDVAGLRRVPYPLAYDGRWHIDLAGLDAALTAEPRVRAIVVVAPNHPTGHVPDEAEWAALRGRADEYGIPLLIDEVFADYPLGPRSARLATVESGPPCLVLSGLSKVAALPQLKLSWVVVHGSEECVAPLLRRAELLADAFLSVATPVQHALPTLLEAAEVMQSRIRARIRANLEHLRDRFRGEPIDVLEVEAGWTALLRLPALDGHDDLGWAQRLLRAGVWVQPGYLFDLLAPPRVAISLLTPEATLAKGSAQLLAEVHAAIDTDSRYPPPHADDHPRGAGRIRRGP